MSGVLHIFIAILATCLTLVTLPGTIELILLTIAGVLPRRRGPSVVHKSRRVAVLIPAHNEAGGIARTIMSVSDCDDPDKECAIVVVADNCTDQTALVAAEAGARVLIRIDPGRRGKGYALDFAFQTLTSEGFEAFIVIDADTVVEQNLLAEFGRLFDEGADGIQCRYGVNNPDASPRTRIMNTALLAFNTLRPRGRDRLGLSCGILGNGFGLTAETLRAVPYDAVSVVEDLEYHLRLVKAGRSIRFADSTTVRADMPEAGPGAKTQRARWEGGRFQMLAGRGPGLAVDVLSGHLPAVEPLLDLLLLPLAFHVSVITAVVALPFWPTRIYAAAALSVVAVHILAAIAVGGGGLKDVRALAAAPFYILWKIAMVPALIRNSRRDADWVRTDRAKQKESHL